MRGGRPTEEQLRRTFEASLQDAVSGRGIRTETGFDMPTENALWDIASAYPDVTDELIEAARRAFAGQLDGSNAARWQAELARKIAERQTRER
ncbi:hypothetical protein [Nocardia sp. CDC160]|uniref:hypothetical protein n=1 Tax=Nocardia sp. CDC160 TaxID=3112166 RepID=UPI002DBE69D1|nr:hypothetical protein [Nocardia sp. CDC160]MEC3913325.1 hypothetical protein [Nocardia sp. CDC160]